MAMRLAGVAVDLHPSSLVLAGVGDACEIGVVAGAERFQVEA